MLKCCEKYVIVQYLRMFPNQLDNLKISHRSYTDKKTQKIHTIGIKFFKY